MPIPRHRKEEKRDGIIPEYGCALRNVGKLVSVSRNGVQFAHLVVKLVIV